MRPYLSQFRALLRDFPHTRGVFERFLLPWAMQNETILEPFEAFREFNGPDNPYEVSPGDLHSFYALSRVCDALIAPLEPSGVGAAKWSLTSAQFAGFWDLLGMEAREPDEFHPFWCEIAEIEAADSPDAPPLIEDVFWPALTFGNLLICRAGVRVVVAGKNHLDPEIAASSPLYFAYSRASRKTHDLSHGWGSNSQWSTAFRRDYVWREHYVFNADGAPDGHEPSFLAGLSWHEAMELPKRRFFARPLEADYALNLAQREELLMYRGFAGTRTESDEGGNFWPYDDTLLLSMKCDFSLPL